MLAIFQGHLFFVERFVYMFLFLLLLNYKYMYSVLYVRVHDVQVRYLAGFI